jgi:hypothetical protein
MSIIEKPRKLLEFVEQPHQEQWAMRLDGVNYLPHYRLPYTYVGPGYGRLNMHEYTQADLESIGGYPVRMHLWPRGGTNYIPRVEPEA